MAWGIGWNRGNRTAWEKNMIWRDKKFNISKNGYDLRAEVHSMDNKFIKMRIGLIGVIVIFSMFANFAFVPEKTDAGIVTPVIKMTCNPAAVDVDVSPGQSGMATSELTIVSTSNEPILVTLSASSDIGFCTLSTNTVAIPTGGTAKIPVVVRVPQGTAFGPATATITGRPQTEVGGILGTPMTATIAVNIRQFAKINLESTQPYIQIEPGKQVALNLKSWNMGNGKDTFKYEVVDLDKLSEKGWSVQLSAVTRDVESQSQKAITITGITPKAIWKDEFHVIKIKVTSDISNLLASQGQGIVCSEEFPFTVYVRGVYIPGFEPVLAIIALGLMGTLFVRRKLGI